jgi:hypothetical protein
METSQLSSLLFLLLLIGFVVWGNLPSKRLKASQDADPHAAARAERDYQLGVVTGMLGGDITEAATLRYAISRLEEQTGRPATKAEIFLAAGINLSL